jgi:hypothetical protein
MAYQDEYRRSGVDYQVLDEVKREAMALAAVTAPVLGMSGGREFSGSRRRVSGGRGWRGQWMRRSRPPRPSQ